MLGRGVLPSVTDALVPIYNSQSSVYTNKKLCIWKEFPTNMCLTVSKHTQLTVFKGPRKQYRSDGTHAIPVPARHWPQSAPDHQLGKFNISDGVMAFKKNGWPHLEPQKRGTPNEMYSCSSSLIPNSLPARHWHDAVLLNGVALCGWCRGDGFLGYALSSVIDLPTYMFQEPQIVWMNPMYIT